MNENQRDNKLALAARTAVAAMETGSYRLPNGRTVSIAAALKAACSKTTLTLPEDFDALWASLAASPADGNTPTVFSVEDATTLAAARRLKARFERVALLNFASARNPGGGFLGGARAQEESLARASGLYATLKTQPEFYAYHREHRSCLYSDRVIFSPEVPVFTDDAHRPLETPWAVSMLTAAAVNRGALARNEPALVPRVGWVMARRIRLVLAVAAAKRVEALVLGAWGCGVFGNDPEEIAALFAEALAEPALAGRFDEVTFAIMNPRQGPDRNATAFRRVFGGGEA